MIKPFTLQLFTLVVQVLILLGILLNFITQRRIQNGLANLYARVKALEQWNEFVREQKQERERLQ